MLHTRSTITHVLFDLDGTLTDPRPGLVGAIQYALQRLGRPVPPEESLLWCIGPPLRTSFAALLDTDEETHLARAIEFYRERYGTTGLYENQVYAGIPEALAILRTASVTLFVATSKPHVFARRIVEHFGLDSFFRQIYGSEFDGRHMDKRDLLRHILEQEGFAPGRALMVGDRGADMVGARVNGLWAGGVTYGYGSAEELRSAGAQVLFSAPADIVQWVVGKVRPG
jgi:phosphoglycolate phosphatase